MDEARLVTWLVQPGESFAADQVLLEIETDKSVIEIAAPGAGRMIEHLIEVDARIPMGSPVARLMLEGAAAQDATAPSSRDPDADRQPAATPTAPASNVPTTPAEGQASVRIPMTPAARAALGARGLEASAIAGSGPGGRVTLSDVQRAGRGAPVRMAGAGASSVPTRHGSIHLKTWEPSGSHGASTTVVLIHGLFADLEAWAATALHLSRAGRRVVALDLPAHGESEAAVADFASLVESVGDAVDAATEGPVVLVGHSFGAAVTAHVLARPGLPVQAAVLLAPLGLGTEIEQRFVDGVLNGGTSEALGRELAKLSTSGAVPSAAYLDELRARIAARRATLAAVCDDVAVNGVQQVFIRGQLDAAPCPVSIVHGRADEIIPWQHALNAPPKVALHLAPHVGHMPQWDATALTTEVIIRASVTR
ncbi:MAG: hypothetical protein ABS55_02395 [Lautropia sp. SCN 70-15]|nr:MAG: hypothetical protein ABS55_02395 [Lautropia sp. SCN 70-15]